MTRYQLTCVYVCCDRALSDAGDDDLPSKSAHLQPEFTQHPWVLEQVTSLIAVSLPLRTSIAQTAIH